jgi:hypothetical protein
MQLRFLVGGLALASVVGACSKPGRSLVPVDVDVDGASSVPSLASVRITVASATTSWHRSVDHDWSGQPLELGIYLPSDVSGNVVVTACGLSASMTPIAFGAGDPSAVAVTPGAVAATVHVTLVPGGPGASGCDVGGPTDGGVGDAADGAADGPTDGGRNGYLAIAPAVYNPPVILTTEGTLDWAHWGYSTVDDFDHKGTGGGRISNLSYTDMPRFLPVGGDYSWTDGTPRTTATDNPSGVYLGYPGHAASFSWTIEATTTTRTLRLYTDATAATRFTLHLSDNSADDTSMTFAANPSPVDITFRADSTPATMSVTWAFDSSVTVTGADLHIAIWAATLR